MNEILPWDIVPAWTAERLSFIGALAQAVRTSTLQSLDKPGDDSWSIGCVFLNRWRAAVVDAARSHPWLKVINPSWHFVFAVDGEPIRVWRAKAEDATPPDRVVTRKQSEIEAKQQQVQLWLPLGLEPKPGDELWFWRLRMVTDQAEQIVALVLEQCNEAGDTRYPWHIQLVDVPAAQTPVLPDAAVIEPVATPMARDGVDLPPVDFEGLNEPDENSTRAANTNASDDIN